MKTIADTTFENIEDRDFCRDASALLCAIREQLKIIYEINNFFTDAREFELILELLRKYKSDDTVCSNVIFVLFRFLRYSKFMKIPEATLRSFFQSGIFDIIRSIVKRSKNEAIVNDWINMICFIQQLGETT